MATFTTRAAEKMRQQALAVSRLMVFVHTDRFRPEDPQHDAVRPVSLPVATADTGKLISAALSALAILYHPGFGYKKAGVMFLDLIPATNVSGGLFDAPDDDASQARIATPRRALLSCCGGTGGIIRQWQRRIAISSSSISAAC
jgi:DNA polymerase V